MEHPKKVLVVTFISNDQTPEVLQPGKQPLDFPPSSVSLQPTSILSRIPSVPAMWSNKFNSVEPQFCVEAVGVVGVLTDQVLRGVRNNQVQQSGHRQRYFMWCRALDVNRNWQPVTICYRHDLCSLAAFRLSDLMSPFLAGARVASINASRTSMPRLALSGAPGTTSGLGYSAMPFRKDKSASHVHRRSRPRENEAIHRPAAQRGVGNLVRFRRGHIVGDASGECMADVKIRVAMVNIRIRD
jgi:hypothetical protein